MNDFGYVPVRRKGDGSGDYLDYFSGVYGTRIDAERCGIAVDRRVGRAVGSAFSFVRTAKIRIVEVPESENAEV